MTSLWRRRVQCLLLSLGFTMPAGRAGATVLAPIDLRELTRDANGIVRGRVAAVDPQWTDDRRGIVTVVTLEVEASLKGTRYSTVRFVVPGGTLGRYRSIVMGAPIFESGQRVLVFLAWRVPSYPHLVGFSQGVFRVVGGDSRSSSIVIPPPLVGPSVGAARVVRGDLSRQPLTLAAFEQRVAALLEGRQ
jgi:hypothetical protein